MRLTRCCVPRLFQKGATFLRVTRGGNVEQPKVKVQGSRL